MRDGIWAMMISLVVMPAVAVAAEPSRTAVSCKGDAIQDIKSFNLPPKTVPEVRTYVIDEAEKSIAMLSDGELVPLCEKSKPACHADFLPGGIKIDFQDADGSIKLVFNRRANTLGHQSENAALTTTFEGQCQPIDPPAIKPAG